MLVAIKRNKVGLNGLTENGSKDSFEQNSIYMVDNYIAQSHFVY